LEYKLKKCILFGKIGFIEINPEGARKKNDHIADKKRTFACHYG
jgi:hypothetical protein